MKSKIVGLVIVLAVVLGFTSVSFAGNPNNSSANGSATAIVFCTFVDGGPPVMRVEEADIFATGCGPILSSSVGCARRTGGPDACVECLNNLSELGFSLLYMQCNLEAAEGVLGCTHVLQGNAAPIVDRSGCNLLD